MAVSPNTDASVRTQAQDTFPAPDDSIRLTDCLIAVAPRPSQLTVNFENPLCRLAARTVSGAGICGHGCGLCGSGESRHTCHLGLTMDRVGGANWGGVEQWVGRRFLSVRAMHKALDSLLAAGFDEEEILNHLPPNPIVSEDELREAANELVAREDLEADYAAERKLVLPMKTTQERAIPAEEPVARKISELRGEAVSEPVSQKKPEAKREEKQSGGLPPVRKPEELIGSKADHAVGNVLEYVEQVHSLLKTAGNRESACERFLRALCATVPFDEMSIFLHSMEANEPVITAAVEKRKSVDVKLKQQSTRLDSQPLGQEAFKSMKAMVEIDGVRSSLDRDFEGAGKIAIPLLSAQQQCQGVWLASRTRRAEQGLLGSQWVRLVQLLGKLLASRLEEIDALARQRKPVEKTAAPQSSDAPWPLSRWTEELTRELSRSVRNETPMALLHVQVSSPECGEVLPMGRFTRAMRREMRGYDVVAGLEGPPNTWLVLLPQIDDEGAQMTAARLVSFFEDLLDSEGGMEERGLRLGIGIAAGCGGEADAQQFMDQAFKAAQLAIQSDTGSPINLIEFPQSGFGA